MEFKPPLYIPSRTTTTTVFYIIEFDLKIGKIASVFSRISNNWIQSSASLLQKSNVFNYVCDTLQTDCTETRARSIRYFPMPIAWIAFRSSRGCLVVAKSIEMTGVIKLFISSLHARMQIIALIFRLFHYGDLKRQRSAGFTQRDFILPELLQLYSLFTIQQGIDPRVGYNISCVDLPTWSRGTGEGCNCG